MSSRTRSTSVRRQPRPGISSLFSGGVDSTYTVLRHRSELTQLVFLHGFDTLSAKAALRAAISQQLGRAADTLGIPLIEISTTWAEVPLRSMRFEGESSPIHSYGFVSRAARPFISRNQAISQ